MIMRKKTLRDLGLVLIVLLFKFANMTNVGQNNEHVEVSDFNTKKITFSSLQKFFNLISSQTSPLVFRFKNSLFILREVNGKLEAKIHWDDSQENENDNDIIRHSFIG